MVSAERREVCLSFWSRKGSKYSACVSLPETCCLSAECCVLTGFSYKNRITFFPLCRCLLHLFSCLLSLFSVLVFAMRLAALGSWSWHCFQMSGLVPMKSHISDFTYRPLSEALGKVVFSGTFLRNKIKLNSVKFWEFGIVLNVTLY